MVITPILNIRKTLQADLIFLLATIACCALCQPAAAQEWVACNDCVDTDPVSTPANATSYGLGRSYLGDGTSGNLINFETGEDTGVTVTFTENMSSGSSINWASDFADFTAGTDAQQTFGGKLNLAGNMSYNDSPGWSLDLTFTNLDPSVAYTFAATVHRNGGASYRDRITNWKIMGAKASTYASSEAAHKVSEESVEFITGHNPEGLVARWTDIHPAADGSFTIRTSHGIGEASGGLPSPNAYKGYAAGLFMLVAQEGVGSQIVITDIEHDPAADTAELTWTSSEGELFDVRKSLDLTGDPSTWPTVMTGIPAAAAPAETTTKVVDPNATEPEAFYKVFKVLPPPVFEDDFESDKGWTTAVNDANGNTLWERGAPTNVGPATGANGSATCYGTNLDADYALFADIVLRSPEFDLNAPGISGARLTFRQFKSIETGFDIGSIRILRASDNVPLGADIAAVIDGISSDWEEYSANLPLEAIGETIRIEFQFTSDHVGIDAGWYLDDVVVRRR